MEERVHYGPGEVIVREGEHSRGFYILQSGTLAVSKQDVNVAEITESGTIFGEMSDLLNEPRTCTITAVTPSEIIYIPKSVDEIVTSHPSIAKKLLITLAKRLQETTEQLWLVTEEKGSAR